MAPKIKVTAFIGNYSLGDNWLMYLKNVSL